MNLTDKTFALNKFIPLWLGAEHEWGTRDCACMVAHLAETFTGHNPMKDWPKYSSEQQAFKAIRSMGFKSLQDAVSSYADKLDGPFWALNGDIMAIQSDKERMPALGICTGPDSLICFTAKVDDKGQKIPNTLKVRRLNWDFAIAAWRIV
jgi:hypothetical protein